MFGIKNGISTFSIKNKKELLQALTDKETLRKILAQGAKAHAVSEYIKSYLRENRTPILEYSMRIKDMVTAEGLHSQEAVTASDDGASNLN